MNKLKNTLHVSADEPEQSWIDFAQRHKAESGFESKESRYAFKDNKWVIKKESLFEVVFVWNVIAPSSGTSNVKTRTDFIFPVDFSDDLILRIYKSDLITRILLLFNSRKIKIGDSELDKKFVVVSNELELVKSLSSDLKKFGSKNREEDFLIQIEGEETGIEGKRILIQVNELLKDDSIIETFFELGIAIQKRIKRKQLEIGN